MIWDLLPGNLDAVRLVQKYGLTRQRELVRMSLRLNSSIFVVVRESRDQIPIFSSAP